ncbi:MAG: hypothetical protein PHT77_12830 [Bacteroidales bacterium]|nr:hypothetical protein [Bacteroidales bacterium]
MQKVPPTYRFGVLCQRFILPRWQAMAIEALLNDGHLPVVVVVGDIPLKTTLKQKIKKYLGKNALYYLFERCVMHLPEKEWINTESLFKETRVVHAKVYKKGKSNYFAETTIQQIKATNPDFLLRFGFDIIRGAILEAAPWGVWSYHHDDELKYRGGPPAFWEIALGDPVTGVMLQRLTDRLDGGIVLKKGYFKTIDHSYSGNLNRVLKEAAHWPALVCKEGPELGHLPAPTIAPLFKKPINFRMVAFLLRKAVNRMKFHFQDLFMAEKWRIALLKNDPTSPFSLPGIGNFSFFPLPSPPQNHFYADPFIIRESDTIHILCEDYNYATAKGSIVYFCYRMDSLKIKMKTIALESRSHLAYPFMFAQDGTIYCIPETADSGNISLYRLNTTTGKLQFIRHLVPGFAGVDSTIIFHEQRWWIFSTSRSSSNESLYIFYSDSLDGNFSAHPANPVKIDIRGARPAGNIFLSEGLLIRPVQMNAGKYGASMALFVIDTLSPDHFVEHKVRDLMPFPHKGYSKGFHTLSVDHGFAVVDGKTYGFNRHYFMHHLSQKIRTEKTKQ